MQAYFHWDTPLPATKRPRIAEIDLNCPPPGQMSEEPKDNQIIEDTSNVIAYPHQWFKGEASNTSPANNEAGSKGKEVVNLD